MGARLTCATPGGSGRVLEADTVTDVSGQASFRWELGEAWENKVVASLLERPGVTVMAEARARYLHSVPEEVGDGWETASLASVGMQLEPLTRMMDSLRAGAYREVHSVVIVKDDRLVFEAYFPGHDFGYNSQDFLGAWVDFGRTTRHNTHSATKSVISALVGLAIDGGLVAGEDEPVFDFFPDYAHYSGGKEAITIRHMLQMRAGYPWEESDPDLWEALLSGDYLRGIRRYAMVVIFIAAAIFTPPDPLSQLLMALPLWVNISTITGYPLSRDRVLLPTIHVPCWAMV